MYCHCIPSATLLACLHMMALNDIWCFICYTSCMSGNPSVTKHNICLSLIRLMASELLPHSFKDFSRQFYPKLMFLASLVCLQQAQPSA